MELPPLVEDLDGGSTSKDYVVGNPTNIELTKHKKIEFHANESSGFSVVIDGNDGFFNPPKIWNEFIPGGAYKTTPEISGSLTNKEYSVFCVNKNDYHGAEKGPGGADSPPKIIIIE